MKTLLIFFSLPFMAFACPDIEVHCKYIHGRETYIQIIVKETWKDDYTGDVKFRFYRTIDDTHESVRETSIQRKLPKFSDYDSSTSRCGIIHTIKNANLIGEVMSYSCQLNDQKTWSKEIRINCDKDMSE